MVRSAWSAGPEGPSDTPYGDPVVESCTSLSSLLWLHRTNLETVLFKLVEEQLVVSSGSARWLNRADAEVQVALRRMQDTEVMRALEVEQLAALLGLPADVTLAQLASAAPEPWEALLDEHRTALAALALEIQAVGTQNRALLEAGVAAVRETLDRITNDLRTDDQQA